MITGVTQSGAEEVEEVHKAVKCYYLLSYMLKPPSLLTQGFKKNKKAQKISSKICVILGHKQSGGMEEEPPVTILMLRPEIINTVWSIQPLWTAPKIT